MPTLNGVLVRRIDLKLSPKVALNCDNRRCLCVFHSTKCLLLFGGRHLEYFAPTGTAVFQSKLGVSSSNQCNLHHSPHIGHIEKKIKMGTIFFGHGVLTFHEARLTSLVYRCDCIIVPVRLNLFCQCDCIYCASVTAYFTCVIAFILLVRLHWLWKDDCIYCDSITAFLWQCDCIHYASVTAFILLVVLQLSCQYDCLCILVGEHLLCHYDCIFATVNSAVAIFLYLWQSGYFSCANKNVLVPAWMHWFCPYDCIYFASVTANLLYDYTIFTAILLLQGHASRNDSWYTACSNHVMNVHGQITIQSYWRIKWISDHHCVGRGSLAFLPTIASQFSLATN